ncbi:MAG: alpha-ketoacid dehydrogenase subunit beta [Chloroflexi bacterium]|nr:alpha-ketoacid dehydrogenase subunit beta [Chloroflexota bacterium]MBV9131274.1 alpha-ketoacid dehydrogenase subunit beta [Chloroflexota bacterium]
MSRELLASRAENEAIRQEMERDPSVIMLGEDIAGGAGRAHLGFVDAWGGPMGSTKGLIQQFGPERILDTPICEMSFIGAAVGAAITGLRPIAELMFVNFIGVSLDSVMNEGAFLRYMLGGQVNVPLVIKTAIGAVATGAENGGGTAAQHSGSMYSMFAHIPGLKCVAPSDAYTAKGLLTAAIRDDNPVVYFSHRKVGSTKMEVPEEAYALPIGKARTLRTGKDVTLVGVSYMANVCRDASALLESRGVDAEVIDLLSLAPIDEECLVESVRRTKHLVVVDEDWPDCSIATTVGALVADQGVDYLDGPIKTVTGARTPVPYSGVLEAAYVPTAERVVTAALATLRD